MRAYVININGSFNNLPCYPSDSLEFQNAVYWRRGEKTEERLLHWSS